MIDLSKIISFDWDDGNSRKSAAKHNVSQNEAESVFISDPFIVVEDANHSVREQRFNVLGKTSENRLLHLTFTFRNDGTTIRVISVRDMNRKERVIYEKA